MQRALPELLLALFLICLPGLVVGAVMMGIAWQYNPHGEFHEPGLIHWREWLTVGLGWFLTTTTVVLLGSLVWGRLGRLFQR